jgi:hypothetical protein
MRTLSILLFFSCQTALLHAFVTPCSHTGRILLVAQAQKENNGIDNEEEEYDVIENKRKYESSSTESVSENNYMDDLRPPSINLKRDSILFSENPSTKRNDVALNIWISFKEKLPAVVTGAWSWRSTEGADANPIGALYNIAFVRLPVIGVGAIYIQNLIQSHPLVMDVGQGTFEVSPFIVLSVLALILA